MSHNIQATLANLQAALANPAGHAAAIALLGIGTAAAQNYATITGFSKTPPRLSNGNIGRRHGRCGTDGEAQTADRHLMEVRE